MLQTRLRENRVSDLLWAASGKRQAENEICHRVFSTRTRWIFFLEPGALVYPPDLDVSRFSGDEFVLADNLSNSIENTIAKYLAEVPDTVSAYFSKAGEVIDIWTILKVGHQQSRRKVYEKEMQISQNLPHYVLNFRVSDPAGEVIPKSENYYRVDLKKFRSNADV
jgi:hypothetical protein